MKKLNLNHALGDTRTTFSTECDQIQIPLAITKRLMGHSLSYDVTNNSYIKKSFEDLREWVERIKY